MDSSTIGKEKMRCAICGELVEPSEGDRCINGIYMEYACLMRQVFFII